MSILHMFVRTPSSNSVCRWFKSQNPLPVKYLGILKPRVYYIAEISTEKLGIMSTLLYSMSLWKNNNLHFRNKNFEQGEEQLLFAITVEGGPRK